MGYKGSNAMDAEESFWEQVSDIVREADEIEVAEYKAIKLAKDKWLVPHLDENQIKEGVWLAVDEIWGNI